MAKKIINIGTSANKGNGDPLRTAFDKVNDNFNELYAGNFVSPTALESSLISGQDGVHDLGSGTKQWGDLHVKDFIYLGGKRLSMSSGGALLVNNGIVEVRDLVGSIFADDSKLMMDGLTGILYGPMIGDVTGSVFADDSTIMVDAVGKLFVGNLVGDVTGTVSSIANHTTADLTENTNLYYTDARANSAIDARVTGAYISTLSGVIADSVDGDLTGSVFGDDSTLLVDGVNNKVMLTTNTTTELAEGTNLYYTNARADARIVNAGSANWNAAFTWGNHASAGYQVAGAPHDGDIEGSVFGDDSTLLVDAVNNIIPSSVVSGTEATNWNTAYSWGDHSVAGYLTSVPAQTFASLTGTPTTLGGYGISDAYTKAEVDSSIASVTAGYFDFNITGDDSTVRTVSSGSTIGIIGGTGITTASDADGNITITASGGGGSGLQSRGTVTGTTSSLADAAEADLDITGFKAYALLTITTDRAARVRLYVSAATRTADASRAEGVDPTSDAGVIAEVITTGAETVIISPGAYGFNLESSPTTTIPCRVTNKSGGTSTVQVDLNILQLEA